MTSSPTPLTENIERERDSHELPASRWSNLALLGIMVLFVAARLWRLTASCLWFDEIFSVHAARHSFAELFRFVAADIIHPPLFYLLLKIWIAIGGESLIWLRLFPALLSLATVVPFLLLCRELKLSAAERNLALLLLAVNGYLIKYAQELRMYSLLLLLSVCSLWLFIRLLKRQSRRTLYWLFLVNFFLVFSHYAGWLVVGVEALALIVWQWHQGRLAKIFLLTVSLTILAYLPWLYLIYKVAQPGKGLAQNIGWVTRPNLWDVSQLFALLNKPFWFVQSNASRPFDLLTALFVLLLLGGPLAMLLVSLWRRTSRSNDETDSLRFLFLVVVVPVVIVFVFSWLLPHSIWGTRHFIIIAAPYSVLVAVAVARLRQSWARITIAVVLCSWFLLAGVARALAKPPEYIWCAWEPLARQVSLADPKTQVRIYAFEDLVAYHLWFAKDSRERTQYQVVVMKNVEGIQEDTAYFLPRRFDEIPVQNISQVSGNEIWIAFRGVRWDETQPPLSILKSMGYNVQNIYSQTAQGQQAFLVRMMHDSK